MATVVDYDYIQEISTQEALHNMTSDVTTGYDTEIPGVNTYKINASTSTYNFPQGGGGGSGVAGWTTNITWSSTDYNTVAWTSGSIYLPDGTALSVSSGNTGNMSAMTYIYYDQDLSSVVSTTTPEDAVGDNKILICVAGPTVNGKDAAFQAFGTNAQSTYITADNVAANTITSNSLIGNTITGRTIQTSSSGERFVMSSSQVAQYDSNGTKRVEYEGDGITFYDSNGIQTSELVGQNGAISTTNFNASYIDAYSVSTDELDVSDAATLKYVTISSSGDFDCKANAEFSKKLRIPVGTNLYG